MQLKEIQAQVEARWQELQTIHRQAATLLNRWGQWRDFADPQPVSMLLERHPCAASAMPWTWPARNTTPWPASSCRGWCKDCGLWASPCCSGPSTTLPAGLYFGWNDTLHWVMASAALALFLFFAIGVPVYILAGRRCDRLLPGPAADAAGSGRRSRLDAGDRQSRLPAAAGGDRVAAAGARSAGPTNGSLPRWARALPGGSAKRPRSRPSIRRGLAAIPAARDEVFRQADAKYPPLLREMEKPLHGRIGRAPRAIRADARRQQGPARARVERNGRALDERAGAVRRRDGNDPRELRAIVPRLERGGRRLLDAARSDARRRPLRPDQRAVEQDPRRHSRTIRG